MQIEKTAGSERPGIVLRVVAAILFALALSVLSFAASFAEAPRSEYVPMALAD